MQNVKIFILCGVVLVIAFVWLFANYRALIYPALHRNQLLPKDYILDGAMLGIVEHGTRDKRQIALTFDADMTPAMLLLLQKGFVKSWYNAEIKKILDRENAEATVFLGGLWTKTYPKEAKDLASDPLIEIGNHSYNHYAFAASCYALPMVKDSGDHDDVEAAQKIIQTTTGITPKYFRFPGGCFDGVDLRTIVNLGLMVVHWDVSAGDGFNNNADSIVRQVESRVQNGSIVVMHIHDGPYAPKTHEALARIIPDLRKQGYQFVTISEMLTK